MADDKENGWNEYEKLVLAELKRLGDGQDKMIVDVGKNRVEIATLKVKAGIWGAIAGLVPGSAALIVIAIKSMT